jgi:hypothetical protein
LGSGGHRAHRGDHPDVAPVVGPWASGGGHAKGPAPTIGRMARLAP